MCLMYLSWDKLTHYFNHRDLCPNRATHGKNVPRDVPTYLALVTGVSLLTITEISEVRVQTTTSITTGTIFTIILEI